MDCLDARTYLPLLTLPPVGELTGEWQAAQQHLEQCTDCQNALRQEEADDRELSRQMSAVSLPDGLTARLQQQIAAQHALLATSAPDRIGRRPWLWATVAAAFVLALITPLLMQAFSPASLSTAEMLVLIEQNPILADEAADPQRDLPIGWSDSASLMTQPFCSASDTPISMFATNFQFRPSRRAEPVSGMLWRVAASQIRDADQIPGLESAQIEYGPGRLVWRENAVVFIVVMDGRALDQLQRKLLLSRSLA